MSTGTQLERARQAYKQKYLGQKDVIGVCSKAPVGKEPWLMIYIEKVYLVDVLPKEFEGFRCEYIVCPMGINCGCD